MAEIRCMGRPVDDRLQPAGQPCGKRLASRVAPIAQVAIATGWSISPDGEACCTRCRQPPREVRELVRQVVRRAG